MCKDIEKKVSKNGYKNADRVMKKGVLLPVHHGLTENMFSRLHNIIESFIDKYK